MFCLLVLYNRSTKIVCPAKKYVTSTLFRPYKNSPFYVSPTHVPLLYKIDGAADEPAPPRGTSSHRRIISRALIPPSNRQRHLQMRITTFQHRHPVVSPFTEVIRQVLPGI